MFFYQNDIIEEEVITSWHEDLPECKTKTEVRVTHYEMIPHSYRSNLSSHCSLVVRALATGAEGSGFKHS